jgi:hypothetical protein
MENALSAGLKPEFLAAALSEFYLDQRNLEPKLDVFVGYLRKKRQMQDAYDASTGNGAQRKARARARA